jgi:hypothetical protein
MTLGFDGTDMGVAGYLFLIAVCFGTSLILWVVYEWAARREFTKGGV